MRRRVERATRWVRTIQEFALLAQTAAQTRDIRPQLTSLFAGAAVGNAKINCGEHGGHGEYENGGNQPEAPFAETTASYCPGGTVAYPVISPYPAWFASTIGSTIPGATSAR